jgi:hypothetical protein
MLSTVVYKATFSHLVLGSSESLGQARDIIFGSFMGNDDPIL